MQNDSDVEKRHLEDGDIEDEPPHFSTPAVVDVTKATSGGGANSTGVKRQSTPGVRYSELVQEQQVQDYGAGKRGTHITMLCIASGISLCMVIAAMSTNVYTKKTTYWSVDRTMWTRELCHNGVCTSTNIPDGACETEVSRQRAIQAFVIITLLSALVAIAVSGLDIVQRCPHEKLPIVTFGIHNLFTLLTWAIIAGGYHAAHCTGVVSLSAQGYKMSVSFSLVLSLWMFQFIMLGFYFVKRFLGAYQRRAIDNWLGGGSGVNASGASAAGGYDGHCTPASRRGGGGGGSGSRRGMSPSATRRDRGLEGYSSSSYSQNRSAGGGGRYGSPGSRSSYHHSSAGHNMSSMRDAVLGKQEMQYTVDNDQHNLL